MFSTIKSYFSQLLLICFVVSGLFINCGQILGFILIRPFNKKLFRAVNHWLQFSFWSQTIAIADWFSNLQVKIYYDNADSERAFCTNSCLVIANHRYDVDWLAAWMLSNQKRTLGNDKAMLKSSLRYVPVIGWGWSLADMIFLSRNWAKDQLNLIKAMRVLLTYPQSPLLAYFEGTRFTKAKHEASKKFAQEHQLDIDLKHHLVPRCRGFNCMMKLVQEEKKNDPKIAYDLYHMEVALDNDDNSLATLQAVLSGQKTCLHIFVSKLNTEGIDFSDEETSTKYLFDLYKKKDDLFEGFLTKGKFPGIEVHYKRRIGPLINILTWLAVTTSILLYLYYYCFTVGSRFSITILTVSTLAAFISIRLLVNSTQVSKSSSYGTNVKKFN